MRIMTAERDAALVRRPVDPINGHAPAVRQRFQGR
jgi:hypothetical protein